jgi:serine/threonine-protein kinase
VIREANGSQPKPPCPERSLLEALHSGKLPEPRVEVLAAHVTACARCSSTLAELDAQDPLLSRLKGCARPESVLEEAGCGRLEALARAISLSAGTLSGATVADAEPGAHREPPLPAVVGAYEVLAKLGQGGMGVVYKARQRPVNRLVALKMVLAGAHAGREALARFRIEGQAVARLSHPNAVPIYEFGEHEGLPYFSMELLEGGSLAARLAQGPLPVREAAELVRTLAGAVEYAHQARVLHRDLKPGNVLLAADGTPKITDFGLAKLLDEDDGQTCSEMLLGTPSYMAPEQAEARAADIGPATDVYALGTILYQALTGRPPFKAATRAETLRQVIGLAPVPPSRLRREVPRALEAICLKCLEKAPGLRYASAQALADDLGRWLRGEATLARPPRWPGRVGRWLGRHRVAVGSAAVLVTVLAVVYLSNPQRYLDWAERELARGRPVTLLAQSGRPDWYRWRAGGARSSLSQAADGSFLVSTWAEHGLLELLPDVPCASYRLRAQVSHRDSKTASASEAVCGVYVGHGVSRRPGGEVQLATFLHFNDIVRDQDADQGPRKPRPFNYVKLATSFFCEGGEHSLVTGPLASRAGAKFAPTGKIAQAPWHTLEVTVAPGSVRGTWDGRPVGELSTARFLMEAEPTLSAWREKLPQQTNLLPDLPPTLPTRGGLGLYVAFGSATFREVVVTPLPGAP